MISAKGIALFSVGAGAKSQRLPSIMGWIHLLNSDDDVAVLCSKHDLLDSKHLHAQTGQQLCSLKIMANKDWIGDALGYNSRQINQLLKKSVKVVKIGYFLCVGWYNCRKIN